MSTLHARVTRHQTDHHEWEMVRRAPHPMLRPYVLGYEGFTERAARLVCRRELPNGAAVLILNFGAPYRVRDPRQPTRVDAPRLGFVSGLYETYVLVESQGLAQCIQVNFTPLGMRRFLGMPMREVTNRVVDVGEVLGAAAMRLLEHLDEAPDWESRFRLVDAFIAARLKQTPSPPTGVAWAWRQIDMAAGCLSIGTLPEELGWSQKHLIAQFREHVGLPPKTLARILRFNRVIRDLTRDDNPGWAEIAYRSGYYDQAHLIRDFRAFAGCTPSEYLGRRLPNGGGVNGE